MIWVKSILNHSNARTFFFLGTIILTCYMTQMVLETKTLSNIYTLMVSTKKYELLVKDTRMLLKRRK